jgi:hypothetical protein
MQGEERAYLAKMFYLAGKSSLSPSSLAHMAVKVWTIQYSRLSMPGGECTVQ